VREKSKDDFMNQVMGYNLSIDVGHFLKRIKFTD
jgi:hypothetical protein